MAKNTGGAAAAKDQQKKSAREQAADAGAKLPEDRQTASDDVNGADSFQMEWGQDENGDPYVYDIDGEAFDDLEVMQALGETNRNRAAIFEATALILGPEQWELFKARQRDEKTGRIKASNAIQFFTDLMKRAKRGN